MIFFFLKGHFKNIVEAFLLFKKKIKKADYWMVCVVE